MIALRLCGVSGPFPPFRDLRRIRDMAAHSEVEYADDSKPANARFTLFDGIGNRFRKPIVHEAVSAYAALAKDRGITLVQLALGYVRSRWHVGATIIGATSIPQLREDIDGAQLDLDAGTLAAIKMRAFATRIATRVVDEKSPAQ